MKKKLSINNIKTYDRDIAITYLKYRDKEKYFFRKYIYHLNILTNLKLYQL